MGWHKGRIRQLDLDLLYGHFVKTPNPPTIEHKLKFTFVKEQIELLKKAFVECKDIELYFTGKKGTILGIMMDGVYHPRGEENSDTNNKS